MNMMLISVENLRDNCARKFAETHRPRDFDWRVIPHREAGQSKPHIVPLSFEKKK